MRIITGSAKGLKLKTLEGYTTRPTAERVKEAVFSMIQFDIEGRNVLDLFAGSGQMALEALSRGANCATLVDKSKDAINVIRDNIKRANFADKCSVFNSDYLDFLNRSTDNKYDIVFLDPPYALKMYEPALKVMLGSSVLKPTSLIVCESGNDTIFENDTALCAKFEIEKHSKYGKTYVTVLRPLF